MFLQPLTQIKKFLTCCHNKVSICYCVNPSTVCFLFRINIAKFCANHISINCRRTVEDRRFTNLTDVVFNLSDSFTGDLESTAFYFDNQYLVWLHYLTCSSVNSICANRLK